MLILAWLCWRGWTRRRMSRAQAVSIAALLVALCLDLYYFSSLLVFGTGSARTVLGNSTDLHSNATAPAATLPVQKSLSLLLVLLFLTILLHVLAVVCVFMVRRLLCALLLCIIVTLLGKSPTLHGRPAAPLTAAPATDRYSSCCAQRR